MQIQDPIHGYITLDAVEEAVLDTPPMQRLRRVRQLGFSSLVYPSATHTRFEHSLGAFSLAGDFASSLGLAESEARHLRLAALLHDVGHGPFSHATDRIFHENGTSHEQFSKELVRDSEITPVLDEHGVDPDRVCALIDGEGRLGTIIAGHIDVDRMDYLMRDAHYTGVAYGTIAADTIIRAARLEDDGIVFDGKYVNALESLLTARYLMIPTVYMHRTSRIAERMFLEAYERLAADDAIAVEELPRMDDVAIRHRLRSVDASAAMLRRVEDRDLYKVASRCPPETDVTELEQDLAGTVDRPETVLVDRIEPMDSASTEIPVLQDGRTTLEAVSPLPAALERALDGMEEVRVYAPEDRIDDVVDVVGQR